MDRHGFVKQLEADGYQADVIDGIVMITVTEEDNHKPLKIKRYVARTGFDGSWGIRYAHDSTEAPDDGENVREQPRYISHRRRSPKEKNNGKKA